MRPIKVNCVKGRHQRRIAVHVLDTSAQAAAKTALDRLGRHVGSPKLELPEGHGKDRMDVFLADKPAHFLAYAERDALVAARYAATMLAMAREEFGPGAKLPPSIAALGVRLLRKLWKRDGVKENEVLGIWMAPRRIKGVERKSTRLNSSH